MKRRKGKDLVFSAFCDILFEGSIFLVSSFSCVRVCMAVSMCELRPV